MDKDNNTEKIIAEALKSIEHQPDLILLYKWQENFLRMKWF